ncbi:MAG: phosphatase PAP2 family protein [Proteobacteria bacterium]|nr:phosphatase PAP2 family protein [Cystobacterineae bacterium]MCL2258903.1 phosphatase PAP2 family protein [Cystobacterineae bacterium]MCL2314732.1 phosphatase PAP2 family protein [Pseudomonadota bacterium]
MLPYFVALLAGGHFICFWSLGELRWEHVAADALLFAFAFLRVRWHGLMRSGLALWLTGMLFDSQRYFVEALRGVVHTGDIWRWEQSWFPVMLEGKETIWPAFFSERSFAVLDLLCGFCYMAYLPAFFAVFFVLLWKDSPYAELLAWAFLVTNFIGVIIYLVFPVAPPWYILQYGPGPAQLSVPGSAAGAARFDSLLGISYFQSFYGRSPNVFGAMPSLHTAYPLLATMAVWQKGWGWRLTCGAFAVAVGFSAVYLTHHYILDVLGGVGVACLGWWGTKRVMQLKYFGWKGIN